MSLFQGTAPPNVTTTDVTKVTAPQYLTDYLSKLAQAGTGALGTTTGTGADATFTPYTSDQLIAEMPQALKDVYANAPGALSAYKPTLDQASQMAQAGGTGITGQDISAFMNPYTQSVIGDLQRQSAQNVQRNLLPQLKSGFVGSGALGSQRYANATGQALGDVQSSLLTEQNKALQAGFNSALDAALKQKGYQIQSGQALGNIGQIESSAANTAAKTGADLGTQELTYNQSLIDAPLTRAANVAKIMQGYNYPTDTSKTYTGPASSYGPSALAQIASLGSLFSSPTAGGVSPAQGFWNSLPQSWKDKLGNIFGGSATNVDGINTSGDSLDVFYGSGADSSGSSGSSDSGINTSGDSLDSFYLP